MAKTLANTQAQEIAVANIVHHGEKLILPEGMTLRQSIELLERRAEYEQEETAFSESYDVLPFDGAHALAEVLIAKFGWAPATSTPGFFGPTPPQLISIAVGPSEHKVVPWGRFSLPNITGHIETGVSRKNNRFTFSIKARILRMNEPVVRSLFAEVREYLKTGSIYQGKAVKIRFRDEAGRALDMPEPSFMDVSKINPDGLIYAADVQASVETNLFTPITRARDCLLNDIPVKRGILLSGTYGTGKTMAATVASRLAVDAGITYVYVPRADELSDAIEFAKQYQSPACVIFCEDIDRSVNGDRSVEMDDILNILDGIDTKNANIITVLTTNDLNSINPAMLRPGRLDAVINVTMPDAKAVERLIRLYAGSTVGDDVNLEEAGKALAGNIPAVISEVVKRAKLSQLRLQPVGEKVVRISEEAIVEAAKTMVAQVTLLRERTEAKVEVPAIETALADLMKKAMRQDLEEMKDELITSIEENS